MGLGINLQPEYPFCANFKSIFIPLANALAELAVILSILANPAQVNATNTTIPSSSIESTLETQILANNEVVESKGLILYPRALEKVAICESGNRHFDKNGNVIRGRVHSPDTGRFQINSKVHLKTAETMGIDIFSEEGNLEYALYLYRENGLKDWEASRKCWQNIK